MLAMAQLGRYWPTFRKTLEEATGVLLEPEALSIEWMRMPAAELMALVSKMDELFAMKPAREWVALLRKQDMVVEVVQEHGELAGDPQVAANEMIVRVGHPSYGPSP